MFFIFNETTLEFIDLDNIINNDNICITNLYKIVPKWKKLDILFINRFTDNPENHDYKEIFAKDFNERKIDVLEQTIVNVYKNLFNICLKEIKKDEFELI